jgi:hypothetical protein
MAGYAVSVPKWGVCAKGAATGRIPGRRVDPESGAIQKGGFSGCFDTGAKAAPKTGII